MRASFILLCLLTSCMVGPDYHVPSVSLPDQFCEAACLCREEPDLTYWWHQFQDPELNELIEEALGDNFDIRIALEKIYEARAGYASQFSTLFPSFEFDSSASRSKASRTLNSTANLPTRSPFQSFYQLGFDALWEIDFFGKYRRGVNSAFASWEASEEDARNVKIIVVSEVVNTYAEIRALQKKVRIAKEIIQLDEEVLHLTCTKFAGGLVGEEQPAQARSTLEADKAALETLEATLRQKTYSLGTLLGMAPEMIFDRLSCEGNVLVACGRIPAGLPSDLLRRRPDIRSAERNLAAQTEMIGYVVADLFPQISLTGSSGSFAANPLQGANIGYVTNMANKLITADSFIWGIGGFLRWVFFDFGQRQAAIDAQVSVQQQALLTYEKTVVNALQEVESALTTYFHEEKRLQNLKTEVAMDHKAFEVIFDQFQAGLVEYSQVMIAHDKELSSQNAETESEKALATALVAIYKALGGEWECCYLP